MSITRIQNNQITDSTIVAYAKLQAGSLTGNLFAPTVTLNSNVTINGNLFLSNTGNTTTINATNTYVNDPIVVFNNGYAGSLTGYDIGILVNRNLTSMAPYGSVNTFFGWVEGDQAFEALATTDTGNGVTSINNSGYANVKLGNTTLVSGSVTGTLGVTGATTLTGTAQVNNTLGVTGVTSITNSTQATNSTTAALVVSGGIGVAKDVQIAGSGYITAAVSTTGTNTGALQVTNGGAYIAGNLWVGGNINFTPNSVNTISGNSAQFFGNAAGFGALYAGIPSGFVFQPQTVLQNSTNFNGYAQVNHQNINNGGDSTTDFVVTADNGTENTYYLDMGIASSGYDNTTPTNALGTSIFPDDSYLYAQGKTGFAGGNLTLGTSIAGTVTRIIAGGVNIADVVTTFTSSGLKVNAATSSSSTTTGALQVAGGAGIVGAAYIGGLVNVAGAATLQSTLNVTGATTLTTATTGGLQAVAIGNVTPGSGAFTTVVSQTETTGGLQAVAIGNVTPGTGAFTTLTAQTETVGGLQAVAIGNVTPGTGVFTTGTFNTATTGGLQAVAIGNVTPGTGAFTTLTASTWANVTGTTDSVTSATGALVVAGGAGIAKNLNVGGSVVVTGNLTVNGSFTTVNTATLDVADLNITIAKGATTPASANGAGLTVDGSAAATLLYTSATDSWNVNKQFIGTGASFSNSTASSSTTTGALVVTGGVGIGGAVYAGSIQNTPIGSTTASTGAFTTITAQTETLGGLQAVAIGNVTPGTGAFTTLTTTGTIISSGNLVAASGTASTSNTTGALLVVGGAGISGNINAGSTTNGLHQIKGNVVLGQGSTAQGADTVLTINMNNTDPIIGANLTVHLSGLTDRGAIYGADSFGTTVFSGVLGRHARGTAASPTAVQAGDKLTSYTGRGYGTTGFSPGNAAGLAIYAAENYTDSAQGTYLSLMTAPLGSNVAIERVKVDNTGNVVVTTGTGSSNTSTGALTVYGGVGIGNQLNVGGASEILGVLTLSNATTTTSSTTGALVLTNGGIGVQGGNINLGGQMFVGAGAQTTVLTGALVVERGTSNTGPGTQYTQHALINGTNTGSADFIAYGDNYAGPSNDHGWMDMGFTSDAFNDPVYSITKANDGYMFASGANATVGGNLVLATDYTGSYNDVVIGVGSFYANSEVARFHGNVSNNGTFVLKLPTNASPAANTGAFQVWGGASVGSNVYVGGATVLNGSQTAGYDTIVKGKNDNTLIWARPNATYDTVIIGNSATSAQVINGAKLNINTTDSIMLPAGTNAQRPGSIGFTDVAGMFRFNTTSNNIEFYNGTSWQAVTSQFTVITDQQFNGTGSTAVFTLNSSQTTASCIVSINGVVQIPTLAYSVSGTTLTFTENPANGDVIDVRMLTTTQTVTNITSVNGYNSFTVDNTGAYIYAGTGAQTLQYSIDPVAGGFVTNGTNVVVATASVATVVDSLWANSYSSAEYTITATIQGTNIREISKVHLVHNGSGAGAGTATAMAYGTVNTAGNSLVTWGATTSGNVAQLQATTTNANTILRIKRNYQAI